MRNKVALMFLDVLLLACGFAFGVYYGQASYEPKVVVREVEVYRPVYIRVPHMVTEYVEVEKVVEVPVEIVKEVEVPVEVEKLVYRNHYIEEFENLETFEEWAQSKLTYLMPSSAHKVDCDDYALHLQIAALQEGKLLSCQLIEGNGYLYGRKVVNGKGYHMGNLLVIGNQVYYVEPHPDEFKVMKICDLD